MIASLLGWIDDPRDDAGVAFATEPGGWQRHSYAELAAEVAAITQLIHDYGVPPGSTISVVLPTGLGFPAAFFGCLAAGTVANPIAPPSPTRSAAYPETGGALLRAANSALVITSAEHAAVVSQAAAFARLAAPIAVIEEAASCSGPAQIRQPGNDLALLQFTSGSTSQPRGVAVSWSNLEANIHEIRTLLRMDADTGTASWLPLHHDMGLIGTLLTPIANGSQLWLMRPQQFLRRPMLMLERMSGGTAVVTAGPMFGYGNIALRVTPEDLAGLDFSQWRAAIVGAERIDPAVLRLVTELLEPYGFRGEVFLPAYGLAEATLVVSGTSMTDPVHAVRVDWSGISPGTSAPITDEACGHDLPRQGGADWVVSCGRPVARTSVQIVDSDRQPLAECVVGEIAVRGPSVARPLRGNGQGDASEFTDGTLYTGDAGFLRGGELFVIGRMGTSLKIRGRTVFVEDLESRLQEVPGLPLGRMAVVAGYERGEPCIIVLGESSNADWAATAADTLRGAVGSVARIRVLYGRRGCIPRTTSGKPRRKLLWTQLSAADGTEPHGVRAALDLPGRLEFTMTQ